MTSKYMVGLICAFCFGVIGKAALDELGYDVVAAAYAEVAGMDYRDLRRDRDFSRAVKYIVNNCSVYIDGDYGSMNC